MEAHCLICAFIANNNKNFIDTMFLGLFVLSIIVGIVQLVNFLRFKHPFIPKNMSFFDVFDSKKASGIKYLWEGIFFISFPFISFLVLIPIIVFYILKILRAIFR